MPLNATPGSGGGMATGFEYKVVKRSSIGCTSGEELERVLNEHAGKGGTSRP
jgi:hypothetical protein